MESINSWRKRKLQNTNYLFDIMDGEVWTKFKINPNDELPFVELSTSNLMSSLNVDWYQPYSNAVYSVGAIYMTILNLDRKYVCCRNEGRRSGGNRLSSHALFSVFNKKIF
ncbi:hypothetical protein BD770DRAFT_244194, partial [Pilaira anomala]